MLIRLLGKQDPQERMESRLNQLVKGCLRDDRKAQQKLYELLSGRMMAVSLRYVSDRSEAQDVLNRAFLKVFMNLEDYTGKGSFEGWVRRIVVNTALDQLRQHKPVKEYDDLQTADEDSVNDTMGFISTLEAEAIVQLIRELPELPRTIFNLNTIEGYTHTEIADMLGINASTSRWHLAKARTALQARIMQSEELKQYYYATR